MPFLPSDRRDYEPLGQSMLSGQCFYLHSDGTVRKQKVTLYLDGPAPYIHTAVRPAGLDFSALHWDRDSFIPDWMKGDYSLILLVAVDFEFSIDSLESIGALKITGSDNPEALCENNDPKHRPGKVIAFRHYAAHTPKTAILSIKDGAKRSEYSFAKPFSENPEVSVQQLSAVA